MIFYDSRNILFSINFVLVLMKSDSFVLFYSLFWTVVQNIVIMPIIFHLFLQIVILENMVLDANRNVVDVQI